ncbi:hypothetical protein AHF37_02221 [Paragonimus kellicotti]|nr:hypothetical protein AHF37_02221 [Paragonimus kellicotti]
MGSRIPVTESQNATCITSDSSSQRADESNAVGSNGFDADGLPIGSVERQISLLGIEPLVDSNQYLLSRIHGPTLDSLFRSELHEPCEAELASQVYEHHHFKQLRERA